MGGHLEEAMHLLRTMLALMIALSVALLPQAGSAALIVKSGPHVASGTMAKSMAMDTDASDVMDECCPDHGKSKPCDQPTDRCPMVFCAVQPVNLAATDPFRFDFPMTVATLLPLPADQVVALHAGSPPFRPPRV
jgi:hypothetical protein